MTIQKWTDDARATAIAVVATELGIDVERRGNLAWCPACSSRGHGSARTFRADDGADRWKCHRCESYGDVIDLAAVVITGDPLPRGHSEAAVQVRAWFASRGWCEPANDAPPVQIKPVSRKPPPELATTAEKPLPPVSEVFGVLRQCGPFSEDVEVREWLERRCHRDSVERLGGSMMVGALPRGADLPRWASFRRSTWDRLGYRAILPMFDHHGDVRSLRARRVISGDGPKALPPVGYGYRGLVLADPLARHLLADGVPPTFKLRMRVVVAEGEPAFLAWSAAMKGGAAVFGVMSGSWSAQIAARIPSGAEVLVATDHDDKGHRYAHKITESLADRCKVSRWRPERELNRTA